METVDWNNTISIAEADPSCTAREEAVEQHS
jgi:hypothetical protein